MKKRLMCLCLLRSAVVAVAFVRPSPMLSLHRPMTLSSITHHLLVPTTRIHHSPTATDSSLYATLPSSGQHHQQQRDSAHDAPRVVAADPSVDELASVGVWIVVLSAFLLVNHFVGPWPAAWLQSTHPEWWLLLHSVSGMVFSGAIVLTSLVEWLVVSAAAVDPTTTTTTTTTTIKENTKNHTFSSVLLRFWFERVPTLNAAVVVPALTLAMLSGTGLATANYGRLGCAPQHVQMSLQVLVAFALWWATTDLTTQGPARQQALEPKEEDGNSLDMFQLRRLSNVVSCGFVLALYAVMVLKPGLY